MPSRKDIKKVLIIGSGPIIIGQACEFDYSETQACKAQEASGVKLPLKGNVLLTVNDKNKLELVPIAKKLKELGYRIFSTENTGKFLSGNGVDTELIKKVHEGSPNISDAIKNGDIQLIINTPLGRTSKDDDSFIRRLAIQHKIPYITTMAASRASVEAMEAMKKKEIEPKPLQEYHK